MGKISETITGYPFNTGDELSSKSLNEITEALDGITSKQDIIPDLEAIRSNAQKATTALQPDALTNYYTKNETDGKLVTKQDVLTAGDNIQITNNVISATDTKYVAGDFDIKDLSDADGLRTKWDNAATLAASAVQESDLQTSLSGYYTKDETDELLNEKQDVLTAGTNIEISGDTISVIGLSDVLYSEITYSELVSLRDASGLTPGMQYRITDYVTTVNPSLGDVQSAGHVFDIIVEATDIDKLSENAKAIQSVRDTDGYFAEVNLDAWELKYCLDNDTNKFTWADPTNGKGVIWEMKDDYNNKCSYDFKNIQFKRYLVTSSLSTASTDECVFYGKYVGQIIDSETKLPKGLPEGYEVSSSDSKFLYTFSIISGNSVLDNTIGLDLTSYNMGYIHLCLQNDIEPNVNSESFSMDLNNIVFVSEMSDVNDITNCITVDNKFNTMCFGNTFMGRTMGNTFGNNCYSNTFGNGCYSNTFENTCYSNTFGNDCYSNTFGNDCWDNTFGNDFQSNTFGNNCYSNTFGYYCNGNTFGNNFYQNTFGNDCNGNTFGNYCCWNNFGNDCNGNTFGNYCCWNNFGNYFQSNTFGNNCEDNTFGNYCYFNTFGNDCNDNTFGNDYIRDCRFGDGVQYCTISGYEDLDNYGNGYYLRNIIVLNGTKGQEGQLLELNENQIFNTHNFKPDGELVPQIVCGFNSNNELINENILDTSNYPIITWTSNSATIKPNTYNIWNSGTYPTQLSLLTPNNTSIVNEYVIRFTIPSSVLNYSLSFNNELKWVDNNIPTWEAGCTYEISIVDGYAVFLKYFE